MQDLKKKNQLISKDLILFSRFDNNKKKISEIQYLKEKKKRVI